MSDIEHKSRVDLEKLLSRYTVIYYSLMTVSVVFGLVMIVLMFRSASPLTVIPLALSVFVFYKGMEYLSKKKLEVQRQIREL